MQAERLLRKQFPSPPVDSLLLGHASQMQKPRHHRWLCDLTKGFGDIFYLRMAHNHVTTSFALPFSCLKPIWMRFIEYESPCRLPIHNYDTAVCLQVVMVSDPVLIPIIFDRALYPPTADVMDRPVDQLLHHIDVVCSTS